MSRNSEIVFPFTNRKHGIYLFRRPECELFAQQEINANPRRLGREGKRGGGLSGCE